MSVFEQYQNDLAAAGVTMPADAEKFTRGYENRVHISFGHQWSRELVADYSQALAPLTDYGYNIRPLGNGVRIDPPKPKRVSDKPVINSVTDVTKELKNPSNSWANFGKATGKGVTVKLGQLGVMDYARLQDDLTELKAKGYRVYRNLNAMGNLVSLSVEPPAPHYTPTGVVDALQHTLGLNNIGGGWVATGEVAKSGKSIMFENGKHNGYWSAREAIARAIRNGWLVKRAQGHIERISFTAPAGALAANKAD